MTTLSPLTRPAGEAILANATLVLPDAVVRGTIVCRDGKIADIDTRPTTAAAATDLDGDYLLPGLVELHTDHLEFHYRPRPKVTWPAEAAVVAHDAQIAASGITTVFDAVRAGNDPELEGDGDFGSDMAVLARTIAAMQARGALRADHLLHVRCEVCMPSVLPDLEGVIDSPLLRLVSLMDHTPGQRQFVQLDQFKIYYKSKAGIGDDAMERFIATRIARHAKWSDANRTAIVAMMRDRPVILASHDDATEAHVAEAAAQGVRIAEFPTTVAAARASQVAGMGVMMGAPNVVRGGSHSGNIAATDLADAGLLDILSSDYVPFSLLQAVFILADRGMTLPDATALVSAAPARATALHDRGALHPGLRADMVRVHRQAGQVPVVRGVWRQGVRVA